MKWSVIQHICSVTSRPVCIIIIINKLVYHSLKQLQKLRTATIAPVNSKHWLMPFVKNYVIVTTFVIPFIKSITIKEKAYYTLIGTVLQRFTCSAWEPCKIYKMWGFTVLCSYMAHRCYNTIALVYNSLHVMRWCKLWSFTFANVTTLVKGCELMRQTIV